jgi:hypothetical protein
MGLKISLADRWVYCPSYQHAFKKSENNVYAIEGTKLHSEAEKCIKDNTESDNEMVKFYLDYVRSVISDSDVYGVEQKFDVQRIHKEINFMKVDFWAFNKSKGLLTVVDLKTGFKEVEPYENWPMMAYAHAILDWLFETGVTDSYDYYKSVKIVIVQPKSFKEKIKSWFINAETLRPYVNRLTGAAHEVYKENPRRKAGIHCINCDKKINCSAFDLTIQTCGELCATFGEYDDYSPKDKIVFLTELKKIIESAIVGETENAIEKINNGVVIPGVSVQNQVSYDWKDDEKTNIFLEMFGLLKKDKPVTPKQAMTEISPSIVEKYVVKKTSSKLKVN